MALPRTPRERWVEEGLRALADGGPDAVRIESLAQAIGVTKGGFYGYFGGRQALLDEMLDAWESSVSDDVIADVERQGGDARERLVRLFAVVSARRAVPTDITVDLAIRHWARRDGQVASRLRQVDDRRLAYLEQLLGEMYDDPAQVRARARLMFTSYIGEHFMVDRHRDDPEVAAATTRLLIG
ncbi:TetR family transcriptional regulator [Luteipulveratus halotolerans]|uniref:TetR family transcriptional regulator n=1 Tax=Luteipulveratus halotolerans TaxID=1631356 RepID=A0A0L6CMZ2_9MICO|nr:TetR family transcriptional regulator [Luteipulveratus halotolerans]KNX39005.1 TetR family transcriptional regulator [Luteipulveratus halotolerans]